MADLAEVTRRLKRPPSVAGLPSLILMTDSLSLPDPLPALQPPAARQCGDFAGDGSGPSCELACRLRRVCRARRIRLLVAADWRLAHLGADGLHLSEGLARHGAAPLAHLRAVAGALAHRCGAFGRSRSAGAAAMGASGAAGTGFATASHPGARPLGPLLFARLVRTSPLPVYALGGIDA